MKLWHYDTRIYLNILAEHLGILKLGLMNIFSRNILVALVSPTLSLQNIYGKLDTVLNKKQT